MAGSSFCGFRLLRPFLGTSGILRVPLRHSSLVAKKRFYRRTSVLEAGGGLWEVTLDQRRVRTPAGQVLRVSNESLALALCHEWDSQKDTINLSTMHLHGLVSTALDNPNKLTKMDLAQSIAQYLETDTVLYHSEEPEDLLNLQAEKWVPIIAWYNDVMDSSLKHTTSISTPDITEKDKQSLIRYLLSHSFVALHGLSYAVDVLKSVVLGTALARRHLGVPEAVLLSRLEEDYQCERWGRVEWSHDISQEDAQARVAAASLIIQLSSPSPTVTTKNK
ncbi:ATP synthase mitochondrial F1 complex assembly factor 2 [Neocloeon triangulifer]|uniref:ATP synthase mitochondrial F1 complex assembly factor 2 n=1 Tax=Neocloeon triangulifer TaxID=2078957 RepID=UPI00286F7706|nr:ATP synthase mitochondrial F1 complex assembly factor 2 [Neocloeon triangulifer]